MYEEKMVEGEVMKYTLESKIITINKDVPSSRFSDKLHVPG